MVAKCKHGGRVKALGDSTCSTDDSSELSALFLLQTLNIMFAWFSLGPTDLIQDCSCSGCSDACWEDITSVGAMRIITIVHT